MELERMLRKLLSRLLSFSKLQFKKLPAEVPVLFRVVELPQQHQLCKVKSLNKGDANSEVTVYYQVCSAISLFWGFIKQFITRCVHLYHSVGGL